MERADQFRRWSTHPGFWLGLGSCSDRGDNDRKKISKRLRISAQSPQGGSVDISMAAGGQELLVFHPRVLGDAEQIIQSVRENRAVVLSTAEVCDGEAQRLIDFACGGMEAIGAQVHRIDAETFLFAPAQVRVQWEEARELGQQVA
jgi:FtsZ-interacting cell division protein YlmF